MTQQGLWDGFFADHYRGVGVAERVFQSAAITTRCGVVDPRSEDVSRWGTGARMRRFLVDALPLGQAAIEKALSAAGLAPEELGLLAVVSCTGYATPGLDIRLAAELGMSSDVQRLHIGHMGCYAAIPGLAAVRGHVAATGTPAALVCVELPSLHLQPPTDDLQQVVAHALFGDAAAAVVVEPASDVHVPGLEIVDVTAVTDVATSQLMTWDVTDLGFRMGLSPEVPDALARHVGPAVDRLLSRHGLRVTDVAGWAVHPGGRRILEVVGEQLELRPDAMASAYEVLDGHGNCSSATVLLVLDALRRAHPPAPGEHVVAMAFGPGLTLYCTLLRGL
jgi:predicted naringenin-chalcone synthase